MSEFKLNQIIDIEQAIQYAMLYAQTEEETAKFALLLNDVIHRKNVLISLEQQKSEHDKMGCAFMYCSQNPKCVGKCYLSSNYQQP